MRNNLREEGVREERGDEYGKQYKTT